MAAPNVVQAFNVAYSRTHTQYIVQRGEIEVIPTASAQDPLAFKKAHGLARALNRVYAQTERGALPAYPWGQLEHEPAHGQGDASEGDPLNFAEGGANFALPACALCGHSEFSHIGGRCVGASIDGPCACEAWEP